jgi:hypothetical protein
MINPPENYPIDLANNLLLTLSKLKDPVSGAYLTVGTMTFSIIGTANSGTMSYNNAAGIPGTWQGICGTSGLVQGEYYTISVNYQNGNYFATWNFTGVAGPRGLC